MKRRITRSDKWVIYGAGHLGRHISDILVAQGFDVCLFVDKYISERQAYKGIQIVTLEQAEKSILETAMVVIAINDYFAQDDLAIELWEYGAHRLLYKTNIICYERYFANNRLYDDILAGKGIEGREITLDKPGKIAITEGGKILEDDTVLFYINEDELRVQTSYHKESMPFRDFTPMVKLYASLIRGIVPDTAEFRTHYQKTKIDPAKPICEEEFERVVDARISIFKSMRRALEFDHGFLLRHPIEVRKSGYEADGFVIVDGLNRASFLAAFGIRYLPCKAPKDDFAKIRNGVLLEKVQ